MIIVRDLSLQFGGRTLFKDVQVKFMKGNCYGVIGANGAGKSTFVKILSGDLSPSSGNVEITPGERVAVLRQDHYAHEDIDVLKTVLLGHKELVSIMEEKERLYAVENMSNEEGEKLAELESRFLELNGWEAEAEAGILLSGLGLETSLQDKKMKELTGGEKVKVLLAQALFGKPEILLLDEPTNDLDLKAINWLENFIMDQEDSVVIVVSHDRHFLNKVCTHICDIDYQQIKIHTGNYDFWYKSSQLAQRMMSDQNKKKEERIKELKDFISRFSANASKSKQATSRRKLLEKISLDDIGPSMRKYPYVNFKPEREAGDQLVRVENLSYSVEGESLFKKLSFTIEKGQKVLFISSSELAVTAILKILAGEIEPDEGKIEWGVTTSRTYIPSDNTEYFSNEELNLVDWLRQYSKDQTESFVRGFLGRMLFSGEEPFKKCNVLSGGEKVRCMLAKSMLSAANVLILDNPTNHLDLESITSLNEGLVEFKGTLLFTSHDHEFVQTIANRIISLNGDEYIDKECSYDEFMGIE